MGPRRGFLAVDAETFGSAVCTLCFTLLPLPLAVCCAVAGDGAVRRKTADISREAFHCLDIAIHRGPLPLFWCKTIHLCLAFLTACVLFYVFVFAGTGVCSVVRGARKSDCNCGVLWVV